MPNLQIRNPHSILAALETRPQHVIEVILSGTASEAERAGPTDPWTKVIKLAREHSIRITSAPRGGSAPGPRGGSRSQNGAPEAGRISASHALVQERAGIPVEQLFTGASERKGGKGIWLALDSLQDPQNVGAIFRTASFFGIEGIVLTQERSAPLSGTVYDVACGGLEYVPFTLQVNLQRAFEAAKEAGLWILGTSEHARENFLSIKADRPWLLVLGNEERGMRRLTQEACDLVCSVPPKGQVTSLNVSVAAGILVSRLASLQ
ncbi:MAG: 23S rRNA (guanosine(2251)-2'-O)-methyltransferase RlmB [Oligoflexia bacterium]|nr:23S rRNA (guanosine(2251)-2'-O)-methyltransferase RlmB [Oligoflexia bacterium]